MKEGFCSWKLERRSEMRLLAQFSTSTFHPGLWEQFSEETCSRPAGHDSPQLGHHLQLKGACFPLVQFFL